MKLLGVHVPAFKANPCATQVSYIEKIIENGFAYEAQGSVYFDIKQVASPKMLISHKAKTERVFESQPPPLNRQLIT